MRVCIATSTRADWGLLSPLARALRSREDVHLDILATNMHLLERYGHTVDEIVADGFDVAARVYIDCADDSGAARVHAMARCMDGTADSLTLMRPDVMVILGDRFEMLAVASAAAMMRVPIVHIAGGEISEGAIDDSIRHAITKLSTLHLTATEEYRRRVIQMGEDPARVINTGALGVWNIMHRPLMSARELQDSLGFDFTPGRVAVATYHPATLDTDTAAHNIGNMVEALDRYPDLQVVYTFPNNDAGSAAIIDTLERRVAPPRSLLVRSLGATRYLSLLQYAAFVIGNSSSGIVEVPSMGIPTIDIGIRQGGRLAAPSVIHCADDTDAIASAIDLALSPAFREMASRRENPYARPDTVEMMVRAITSTDFCALPPKRFHNLSFG